MEFNTYTELINQYYADEKRAVLEYDTYRRATRNDKSFSKYEGFNIPFDDYMKAMQNLIIKEYHFNKKQVKMMSRFVSNEYYACFSDYLYKMIEFAKFTIKFMDVK